MPSLTQCEVQRAAQNTIASLFLKGTDDPDSYFAAGKFADKPKIGSANLDPATDDRFLVA